MRRIGFALVAVLFFTACAPEAERVVEPPKPESPFTAPLASDVIVVSELRGPDFVRPEVIEPGTLATKWSESPKVREAYEDLSQVGTVWIEEVGQSCLPPLSVKAVVLKEVGVEFTTKPNPQNEVVRCAALLHHYALVAVEPDSTPGASPMALDFLVVSVEARKDYTDPTGRAVRLSSLKAARSFEPDPAFLAAYEELDPKGEVWAQKLERACLEPLRVFSTFLPDGTVRFLHITDPDNALADCDPPVWYGLAAVPR